MRRRGFLINSAVIVLIIPLLLLLAVYSNAQSQITNSQSERLELQRLSWAVSYVQADMKNALRISGKRALVSMINYVVNGSFITKANVTMADLMLDGKAPGITGLNIMANQTLKHWLDSVAAKLRENGLVLSTSDVSFYLQVDPLDSFQIAVKARITNVTIRDLNGRVIYRGSLPTKGYVYSVIDITGLEDPSYALATKSSPYKVSRVINICNFPYPEIGAKPVKWVLGVGNSTVLHIVGDYYSSIFLNSTAIWTVSPQSKLFNLSANPERIFGNRDRGVLVYGNVTLPTLRGNWGNVSTNYNYRVNFTLTNFRPDSLTLLVIDMNDWTYGGKSLNQLIAHTDDSASILIYDSNGRQIPFWIEYWSPNGKLWLWMKTTNVNSYSLYFSDDPSLETRGYDASGLFYVLDDFLYKNTDFWNYNDSVQYSVGKSWLFFNSTGETRAAVSRATFSEPFFVRWGMNTSQLNAGVGLYRPPTAGQNYLDVVVRYGRVNDSYVYWPYNTSGTSSVSRLSDVIYYNFTEGRWNAPPARTYDGDTHWINTSTDAQTAKEWLDEQLVRINGTSVAYRSIQVPIYLNSTQIQGILYSGNNASIEIVNDEGKPVPFWIEYWNKNGALIWVKVNLTRRYYTKVISDYTWKPYNYVYGFSIGSDNSLRYSHGTYPYYNSRTFYYITLNTYVGTHLKILYNTGEETRGNGSAVFEFFDNFSYLKAGMSSSEIATLLKQHGWNVGGNTNYLSAGNGVLELGSSSLKYKNRLWLWTKKTFPYYRYVIGMDVYIRNQPFWMWYIDSTNWAWMEHVIGKYGYLGDFNVQSGGYDDKLDTGGRYKKNAWTQVEIAIDYNWISDNYADVTTYQNQTGPFIGTWSGDTKEVSYYDGWIDDIYSENNTAVGLGQFYKGPSEYQFFYVRKYLNLTLLNETIIKHQATHKPVEYEATGSSWTPYLILWKNWIQLTSGGYSPSGFNRYDLNVSATELNLTRVTGTSTISYTGSFTGSWNVSIVAKVANGNGEAKFDWIIIGPPYVTSGVTFSGVLQSPNIVQPYSYSSAAFDLQPFLNCLENDSYFGVYAGPSLFERLEGKLNPADTGINGEYWNAAKAMQRALGLASNGHYYPIGLVSFVYPPADTLLMEAAASTGKGATNVSSADYYWFSYYFPSTFTDPATPLRGYRVWGISWGTGSYSYLSSIQFFLDNGSAYVVFGRDVWKYLSYR